MKEKLKPFLNPTLCALLGFIGAVCITPFSGVITTLPLLPLCGLAASFLKLNIVIKILVFACCGAVLSAGYSGEPAYIILYAIICGVTVLLCEFAHKMLAKSKTRFWAILPVAAAVAIQTTFGGNIVSYINAKQLSDDYVNANYDGTDEVVDGLEYDFLTQTWRRNIYSLPKPEVIGNIVIGGEYIHDNYVDKVEQKLMEEKRAELASVLRKAFPDGRFTVASEKISGYPEGNVFISDTTDYSDKMVFVVYLGELTDRNGFLKIASAYNEVVMQSSFASSKVIFRGGGLGLSNMEAIYLNVPTVQSSVKFNCHNALSHLQYGLDEYFINK